MRMKRCGLILFALMLCFSAVAQTSLAADAEAKAKAGTTVEKTTSRVKKPTSIKLNNASCITVPGKKFTLKATVSPKSAAKAKVVWKSSNEKVAKVSRKGRVTIVGIGTARITAKTENGKKAVCKIESRQYIKSSSKLSIGTPDGAKDYKIYYQANYRTNSGGMYYRSFGCVVTAVAIIASACKDKDGEIHSYTPKDIHEGSEKSKYSEKYAVKKMGNNSELSRWYDRAAISLRTASTILKDIGIKNKVVYTFTKAKAKKEIRKQLKQGKPVIVKANNNMHNGIRLTNEHHALVLVGIDSKDQIIYLDPGRTWPYTLKLSTLVDYYMTPASGNYKSAYMTDFASSKSAGGYILIE